MNSKKNFSGKKNNSNNNSEEDQIKSLIKEINITYRNTLFFDTRTPNKLKTLVRNRSNFSTINIKSNGNKTLKRENSLTFKLKNKINKESLILELREELKYHIQFNFIYKKLLEKTIQLKDHVKENKEKLEENTNALKETFKDSFNIINNYEKTIKLLDIEKKELIASNKEILKIKKNINKKLLKQFNEIQEENNVQRIKIDDLGKNITLLEFKRDHLTDELQDQFKTDETNYEKHMKLYKSLVRKYEYYLEEYNTYMKSGNEIAKIDVKLFDDTRAKNTLIEENLDIKLNEQLLKKENLMDNINDLKEKIKILEEKQKEEQEKEEKEREKKVHLCKFMGLYKSKLKNMTTFRKSASNKTYKKKHFFQ